MEYYIWGVGDSGISLYKDWLTSRSIYKVAGFIDSNPVFWGKKYLGIHVYHQKNLNL